MTGSTKTPKQNWLHDHVKKIIIVQGQSQKVCQQKTCTVNCRLRLLNGGLREGDSQMLVSSHIVIVKINQGLDSLFYCWHLDQSHFTISKQQQQKNIYFRQIGYVPQGIRGLTKNRVRSTYWKNLKAFTMPPVLEKSNRRSSSVTFCLENKDHSLLQDGVTGMSWDTLQMSWKQNSNFYTTHILKW